ncbi:unnamed protein product [Laminaria digitata]
MGWVGIFSVYARGLYFALVLVDSSVDVPCCFMSVRTCSLLPLQLSETRPSALTPTVAHNRYYSMYARSNCPTQLAKTRASTKSSISQKLTFLFFKQITTRYYFFHNYKLV